MERRLAAILVTDVVGYSRMIRADEEDTIAALKVLRADHLDPPSGIGHDPALIIVGSVVTLRDRLSWFEGTAES